jgi:hypothetical protein
VVIDISPVTDASPYAVAARSGARWLVNGAGRNASRLWLSPDLGATADHASLKLATGFRVYRSTSRGVAGVVYVLARLHRMGIVIDGAVDEVNRSVDWLLSHADTPDDQMPGLHFGEAGVAVAIAETIAAGMLPAGSWTQPYLRQALTGPLDWPDLSHGAAGQGVAALACADLLAEPEFQDAAERCAAYLLDTEDEEGGWTLPAGVFGMSGGRYTGFAHGAAGIMYFLARWAERTDSDVALEAAVRTGEWLLDMASADGNYRSLRFPVSDTDSTVWKWWCHGAPGIALAFLALWRATGDERYAGTVRACLRSHPPEPRHPNLSQCHGLAGLGEAHLEAYRAFTEPEWLERAEHIGATLTALARVDDTGASWLVENPYTPTADLMIGCGGVVHFLTRLAQPDAPTTPSAPLLLG